MLIMLEVILTSACPPVSGTKSPKGIRELLKLLIVSKECSECVPGNEILNVSAAPSLLRPHIMLCLYGHL